MFEPCAAMIPMRPNSELTEEPNLLPPASLQPACFAPLIDPTVARLAYGRRGLPKLVRGAVKLVVLFG